MATALSKQYYIAGAHVQMKTFILATILSFDAVCVGSSVIIMLQKSKQTSLRKMFTSISAGVGDLPCFPTFFSMIPNQT